MREEFKAKIAGYAKGDKDDQVSLFQIVDWIERTFKEADPQTLKSLSLEFVRDALAAGFKAGRFSKDTSEFYIWSDQNSQNVCSVIEKEWATLGRKPILGEIVWLGLPQHEYQKSRHSAE